MPSFRKHDDRSRAVKRVMRNVHDAILKAYALRSKTHHLDQAKLADKLGVDKAIVSRRLRGASNMTERTLAETFWALGHELIIEAVPVEKFALGNVSPYLKLEIIDKNASQTVRTPAPVANVTSVKVTTAGTNAVVESSSIAVTNQ